MSQTISRLEALKELVAALRKDVHAMCTMVGQPHANARIAETLDAAWECYEHIGDELESLGESLA